MPSGMLLLARLRYAGATTFAFVIAAWVGPSAVRPGQILTLVCAGTIYHALACTINDIADRHSDSLNPHRATRPLVSGTTSVAAASYFSAALGVTFFVISLFVWHGWFLGLACAVLALNVVCDAFPKTRLIPPAWDVIFGIAMAGCVILGAACWGRRVTEPAILIAVCYGLWCAFFNTSASNLKDLQWDQLATNRTSSMFFGCHVDASGVFCLSRRYQIWVTGIAAFLFGAIVLTACSLHETPSFSAAITGTTTLGGAVTVYALNSRRTPLLPLTGASALMLAAIAVAAASRSETTGFLLSLFAAIALPLAADTTFRVILSLREWERKIADRARSNQVGAKAFRS
jgi:4-hydroxybenzoate polyprenyltransferase